MRAWLITGVALLLCSTAARAASVDYTFSGTLDTPGPGAFTGQFTLDYAQPNQDPSNATGFYQGLISNALVHLPAFDVSVPDPDNSSANVIPTTPGLFVLLDTHDASLTNDVSLHFTSNTSPATTGDLPNPLRLSDFDTVELFVTSGTGVFHGLLTTLTAAPAPSAAPLPATAPAAALLCAGVALSRRRRQERME